MEAQKLAAAGGKISLLSQRSPYFAIYEEGSLWTKFQIIPALFTGVIVRKSLKVGPIGSWTTENEDFLPGKVDNDK